MIIEVIIFVYWSQYRSPLHVTKVSTPSFSSLNIWVKTSLAFLFIENLCLKPFCSYYTGNRFVAPIPAIRCWALQRTGHPIILGTRALICFISAVRVCCTPKRTCTGLTPTEQETEKFNLVEGGVATFSCSTGSTEILAPGSSLSS